MGLGEPRRRRPRAPRPRALPTSPVICRYRRNSSWDGHVQGDLEDRSWGGRSVGSRHEGGAGPGEENRVARAPLQRHDWRARHATPGARRGEHAGDRGDSGIPASAARARRLRSVPRSRRREPAAGRCGCSRARRPGGSDTAAGLRRSRRSSTAPLGAGHPTPRDAVTNLRSMLTWLLSGRESERAEPGSRRQGASPRSSSPRRSPWPSSPAPCARDSAMNASVSSRASSSGRWLCGDFIR